MIGLAFFVIGVAIIVAFVVIGWKMAYKDVDDDKKGKK